MPTFLDLVKRCDNTPYPEEKEYADISQTCYRFRAHDGAFLGWVLPIVAAHLKGFDSVLVVDDTQKTITITSKLQTVSERSETLSRIVNNWREQGTFKCLEGWRDELYSVYNPTHEVYIFVERSAACLFGFVTYGVHIIGYQPATESDEMKIWVPRRSKTKQTNPGKLDNTVAGGIGYPHGKYETAIKECAEEAGLGEEYVKTHLNPAGVVSYAFRREDTVEHEAGVFQPEVEYIYDLVMEPGVIPKPVDGEVESFELMSASDVKRSLVQEHDLGPEWKYNCALIQVDFFIRHGLIDPEEESGYHEIQNRCHRRIEHPVM